MERNLDKYLKHVKMTGEMARVESQIDSKGLKRDKISLPSDSDIERLYKNAFDSLRDDDIQYIDIFIDIEKPN